MCIRDSRDKVEAMVAALLEWETLDADQITDIMEGRPPRTPKPPPVTTVFGNSAGTTTAVVESSSSTAFGNGPASGSAPATA